MLCNERNRNSLPTFSQKFRSECTSNYTVKPNQCLILVIYSTQVSFLCAVDYKYYEGTTCSILHLQQCLVQQTTNSQNWSKEIHTNNKHMLTTQLHTMNLSSCNARKMNCKTFTEQKSSSCRGETKRASTIMTRTMSKVNESLPNWVTSRCQLTPI